MKYLIKKTFVLEAYSFCKNIFQATGVMFCLLDILHSDSTSVFSETFQHELLHMFAIAYAMNHIGWGIHTDHGYLPGASSCSTVTFVKLELRGEI